MGWRTGTREEFEEELCVIPSEPEIGPKEQREQLGRQAVRLEPQHDRVAEPRQEGIPGSIRSFRKVA